MADLGGIPGQVVGELKGVVADAAKGVIKAGGDIAKGTVETLIGAQPTATQLGGLAESAGGQATPQTSYAGGQAGEQEVAKKQQKAVAAKRRLDQVRAELEEYRQKKKKEEEQEEQVAEQKAMEEMQVKKAKKKQQEEEILGRLGRQYGGTGEIGKGGN